MPGLVIQSERRLIAAEFQLSTEQNPMEEFEPIRDFFQRRQAKWLDAQATPVQLFTECQPAERDTFVFPGQKGVAAIQCDGQRVGYVNFSINPLRDRLYIGMIKIESEHPGDCRQNDCTIKPDWSGVAPQRKQARQRTQALTNQPQLLRPRDRLGAPLHAELAVDMARVGLDRVQGDEEAVTDLLVRTTLGDQLQHRQLAGAQGFMVGRRLADSNGWQQRQQALVQ